MFDPPRADDLRRLSRLAQKNQKAAHVLVGGLFLWV